jgi:phage terminase large subunit-like protein
MVKNITKENLPLLMFDIPKVFEDCLVVNKDNELGLSHKFLVMKGGRGSCKSQSAATILLSIANSLKDPCKILCLRELNKTTKDSLHEMFMQLINGAMIQDMYTITNEKILNKSNGVEIMFTGAREKGDSSENKESILNSIKSMTNIRYIWFEESQYLKKRALDIIIPSARSTSVSLTKQHLSFLKDMGVNLDLGTNFSKDVGFIFTLNPQLPEDDVIKYVKLYKEESKILHVNIVDVEERFQNKNLLQTMEAERLANDPEFKHKWYGEPKSNMYLGMFKQEYFKRAVLPTSFEKVYIGLDIAISNNKKSDKTGIVVIGKNKRNDVTNVTSSHDNYNYFVIDDLTGNYSPDEWSIKIDELYQKYKEYGVVVVIETNQGGDMIANTIRNRNIFVNIKEVKAVKNKVTRAEPVSSLYAMGRVFHCCNTTIIEEQLLRFSTDGYQAVGSPDNADALVWAITEAIKSSNVSVVLLDNIQ